MIVTLACRRCAGSGQFPNDDGSRIDPCPHCRGKGHHAIRVTIRLASRLRRLVRRLARRDAASRSA